MTNRRLIYFLLSASILLMVLLRIQGNSLITPVSATGILSLEFAFDSTTVAEIVHAWHQGLQSSFTLNMVLDFVFIFFYTCFFYFTCLYYSWTIPRWKKIAALMAAGALAAGVSDFLENILMIISYNGMVNGVISFATFFLATLKFVIVFLLFLFIMVATLYVRIRRSRMASDRKPG